MYMVVHTYVCVRDNVKKSKIWLCVFTFASVEREIARNLAGGDE